MRLHQNGFTVVELMVIIGLIVIIAAFSFSQLAGRRASLDASTTAQKIVTALKDAQTKAITNERESDWGVRFVNNGSGNSFFAVYAQSYETSTVVMRYGLPVTVSYETSTVASNSFRDIVFYRLSGNPSASTTITINSIISGIESSTVRVASSGLISY
ncbi:MAG: hypothetical protein RIQ54_156 [Candidatus Parcubacteria bacterium]|jgi:Tfp pilus assembly protein FimT